MLNTAQGKVVVDGAVVIAAGSMPMWVTQIEGYMAAAGAILLVIGIAIPRAILAWRELLQAPTKRRRKEDQDAEIR